MVETRSSVGHLQHAAAAWLSAVYGPRPQRLVLLACTLPPPKPQAASAQRRWHEAEQTRQREQAEVHGAAGVQLHGNQPQEDLSVGSEDGSCLRAPVGHAAGQPPRHTPPHMGAGAPTGGPGGAPESEPCPERAEGAETGVQMLWLWRAAGNSSKPDSS